MGLEVDGDCTHSTLQEGEERILVVQPEAEKDAWKVLDMVESGLHRVKEMGRVLGKSLDRLRTIVEGLSCFAATSMLFDFLQQFLMKVLLMFYCLDSFLLW